MKYELLVLAGLGVGFGVYCIYEGHNSTVISSVFGLLGLVGGYIIGKKTTTEEI